MNILLLNPPFKGKFSREQRSPAVTKSGTLYYPMWLAYATGTLEKEGFHVKLVDAPAAGMDENDVLKIAKELKPSLVVIDTSTPSIYSDVKMAEQLKELAASNRELPIPVIALVGPHVSATAEETLKLSDKIDIVCRGEYDYTLTDLARNFENKPHRTMDTNWCANVQGISYRADTEIVHNPARPAVNDLDAIPFVSKVYKSHLDYTSYFYAHSQHPIVTIISGRGCPHKCFYCVYPQTFSGKTLRYRSVKNVVDELEFIVTEFEGLKEVMFEDDTLAINRTRCREFCEAIISRNLHFKWSANSRADVDYETLRLMKKAGCRLLCVGFESGDQQVLDNMKKGIKLDTMKEFAQHAKRAGILVHGCFLLGNPGETKETMRRTLEFAKELNPDTAQFFPIMVYPGTEAYEWAQKSNYLRTRDYRDWLTPEGLHNCVVDFPHLPSHELVQFCNQALKEFYLRPSYMLRKSVQIITNPSEGKRILKSLRTFAKYLLSPRAERRE
jgi:radical SAM superfamily enzyme YgiQ (UPF0313 family)